MTRGRRGSRHGRAPAELLGAGRVPRPAGAASGRSSISRTPGAKLVVRPRPRPRRPSSGRAAAALTTIGVPQASASSAASPKVSTGPGAIHIGARQQHRQVLRVGHIPGKPDRQPCLRGPLPSRARSGPSPATTSRPARRSGAARPAWERTVGSLLDRQPRAQHEQRGLSHAFRARDGIGRVRLGDAPGQVDAQRHAHHVRRADPPELLRRPLGGADHPVVVPRAAGVEGVGEARGPLGAAGSPCTGPSRSRARPSPPAPRARGPTRPVQRGVVRSDTSSRSGPSSVRAPPPPAVASAPGSRR